MLSRKTVTKKQKKEASRKKLGIIFVILGLVLVAFALFLELFFDKKPLYINPLSSNQNSTNSSIEKKLKDKKIEYSLVATFGDYAYSVTLLSGNEVIIDAKKDIDTQLSSLQLILSQLKIDGRIFKRLDFRYQKPVITF